LLNFQNSGMNTVQDSKDVINFSKIGKEYASKWYVFAICVVVCVALAWFYGKISPQPYEVKANLLITNDGGSDGGGLSALLGQSANVHDEFFSVGSHSVLKDVARELSLNKVHRTRKGFMQYDFNYRNYPVDVECAPALPDTLRSVLLFTVKVDKKGKADVKASCKGEEFARVKNAAFPVKMQTPYGDFTIVKTDNFVDGKSLKTKIALMGYDDAAEEVAHNVEFDIPSRKASIISMCYPTPYVSYAKDVLNCIIATYNQRGLDEKNVHNRKSLDFIDSRLALLGQELVGSEENIENFKKNNGIVDMRADVEYQMTKKGQLEQLLVTAETELQIVKMVRDFISDPANQRELVPATLAGSVQGNGTDNFIGTYNNLILKRIELQQNAHSGNAALAAIDTQIDAMRKNLLSTINKSYESTQLKVNELRSQMGTAENELGNVPSRERAYRDIVRQQSIKEKLYVYLLQQREQTHLILANSQFKGQVIDEAYAVNDPLGLSTKMKMLIGFIVGVLLAAVGLYVRGLFRNKFSTRDELEDLTSIPVLGEMSNVRSGETLVVRSGGSTSAAELFRLIRTNLQFMLGASGSKVVLLTSSTSGEGKSFIAINLASSLALLGKKVVLVGLDIRKPKLQEYLGLPASHGFTEYVAGDTLSVNDIICRNANDVKGLDVITAGPICPNPSELLYMSKVETFFSYLREHYDYIIVDSAPVGLVSDTFTLAKYADATVYVCRVNYTTKSDIRFANTLYSEGRLKNLSLVVNGTSAHKTYGYGDNK